MRLSWNEIRARAAGFAEDWKDAAYEKGETQSFYNDFFEVFGKRRREVARYEQHVVKLDNHSGFIDLFWPGVLLVEQKSAGRDLGKAYEQAGEYFDALPERALHSGEEAGPDSGGLDGQREFAQHDVSVFVFSGSGSGGANAPGEGGLRLVAHARGSLFGPRGGAG